MDRRQERNQLKRKAQSPEPSQHNTKKTRTDDSALPSSELDTAAEPAGQRDVESPSYSRTSPSGQEPERNTNQSEDEFSSSQDQSADDKSFSIFNAMVKDPDICLEVSKHLPVEDLITFYTISQDFHFLVNQRMTTFMYTHAKQKAPESTDIFIHRCYPKLCIRDPVARRLHFSADKGDKSAMRNHLNAKAVADFQQIRFVPSFRWLQMILFREAVVYDILRSLALEGHRFPSEVSRAIKKIWFTMDLPYNRLRVAMMHNSDFWTRQDLYLATMFFVKLDMRFTDPVVGGGHLSIRKMLIGQRSLSTLADVLQRVELRDQGDLLRMILQYDYIPPRPLAPGTTLLGVPESRLGKLSREAWGMNGNTTRIVPVDGAVLRESIRRNMNLAAEYLDMMIYGYVDQDTYEDIHVPEKMPIDPLLAENTRFLEDVLGEGALDFLENGGEGEDDNEEANEEDEFDASMDEEFDDELEEMIAALDRPVGPEAESEAL